MALTLAPTPWTQVQKAPHPVCLLALHKPSQALLELLAEEATLPRLASRQGGGLESSKEETVGAS